MIFFLGFKSWTRRIMKADILMKITKRFRQEMFKQMKNCVSESIRAITRKIPNTDK